MIHRPAKQRQRQTYQRQQNAREAKLRTKANEKERAGAQVLVVAFILQPERPFEWRGGRARKLWGHFNSVFEVVQ